MRCKPCSQRPKDPYCLCNITDSLLCAQVFDIFALHVSSIIVSLTGVGTAGQPFAFHWPLSVLFFWWRGHRPWALLHGDERGAHWVMASWPHCLSMTPCLPGGRGAALTLC